MYKLIGFDQLTKLAEFCKQSQNLPDKTLLPFGWEISNTQGEPRSVLAAT